MNNKKCLALSAIVTFTATILAWLSFYVIRVSHDSLQSLGQRDMSNKTRESARSDSGKNILPETKQIRIPSKEERLRMSPVAVIKLLEELGYVPDDPNMSDYYYAEKTSWWGKRLDPKEFWKGKVVWYDKTAEFESHRRGRGWPPIPYEDSSVVGRSDIDKKADGFHIEGSQPNYVSSEREKVFWINFMMTHPQPPESIRHWLGSKTDSWMNMKIELENKFNTGESTKRISRSLDNLLFIANRDAKTFWYPPESATPEAFHWDHVMRKRVEYAALVASGNSESSLSVELFFNDVYVDHALITEPLTQNQIDAANAWKVAYLNRLRAEKWDESYINAYLQAWNLSEEYVFGKEKK